MLVLATGAGLLVLSFLVQFIVWRVMLPSRQTPALLAIFAAVPVIVVGFALLTGTLHAFSIAALARVGLLYVSCSLAYIVLYSAIEMESPTLAIVSHLARAGTAGCTGPELFERFGRENVMGSRILVMETGGWVVRDGDVLTLTPNGRFYARLFEYGSACVGPGMEKGG